MRLDIPDILTRFLQLAMLSWGYPGWLWGLAFTAVGSGLSRVARWPYTEECRQPTGLRYKPLTFSWFHGLLPNGTDLRAERLATWWVSPSVSVVVEGPALGLRLEPKVRLGPHPVMVERTGLDPAPVFGEAVTFTTRSSITLSTGQRRADGKLVNRYLSPEQPGFARALAENLRRKAAVFCRESIPGDLEVRLRTPYSSNIRGRMLSRHLALRTSSAWAAGPVSKNVRLELENDCRFDYFVQIRIFRKALPSRLLTFRHSYSLGVAL
jgi:CRISPR-associated endoribonuclease Cas6